jgi:general secretion pathway protein N
MTRWQWFAAGTIAYLAMLVATAPATLVDAVVGRASEGRLRVAEARGSVWSGAGRIQLLDASRQAGISKDIAWRWMPGSALRGRLVGEMELDSSARRFEVAWSPARIEVTDADINVPAAILGIAEPKLAPFGLGGDLMIHITDLVIRTADMQANATVVWRSASSAHTKVSPLGDYELRFEHSGTARTAILRTLGGPLQLDGTGAWTQGARPAFKAAARISPQYREELEPLMRMIGVERGAGNFEFQLP